MDTVTTADRDLLSRAVSAIGAHLDSAAEGVTEVWPRDHEAARLGPEGVLLSAQITPRCPGCGQRSPWVPAWVEGHLTQDGLSTSTVDDRECGCGTWQQAAQVFIPLGELDRDDFAVEVAALREQVRAGLEAEDAAVRARLIEALREWIAALATGADPEADQPRGSDTEPGIWRGYTGRWEAWDYATGDDSTTIVVTEADLAGAAR